MRLRTALLAGIPAVAALGLMSPATAGATGKPVLEKLPYSGSVLVARAIRAGAIHLPANQPHGAAKIFPALNCKPGPCVLPDVDADAGTAKAVDETPIAVNPLNGKQLISGGNDYACTASGYRGFWTSNSGGSKWAGACGKTYKNSGGDGDPIVGYDLNGNVFQGGIDNYNGGSISLTSSSDNGNTWNSPVLVLNKSGYFTDKPWLQVDTNANSPNKNDLYISNTMFGSNSATTIYVSHSTDGGATWTNVAASPTASLPHINQFSDLAIGADGTVYLTYMDCPGGSSTGDCGGTTATMYIQKSTDGGNTWSSQVAIGTAALAPDTCGDYYGTLPNTCVRLSNIPSIGIDNSGGTRNGQLYVTDYNWNGANVVVQVTSSTDGGTTWSAPVPVGDSGAKNDQFFPWLTVDASGNVGVSWFDRRNDTNNINYEEFGTWSKDGGNTFATNLQLADQTSNPNNDGVCGCFIGDYSGNAWDGKKLYASWTDTRNGHYAQLYVGGLKPGRH